MRARHRHFNPANAGASIALDSRYGFSVSNNSLIDTWSDRSSNNNNATQTTTVNRPTYKTQIQGGQPAIEFQNGPYWLSSSVAHSANYSFVVTGIPTTIDNNWHTWVSRRSRPVFIGISGGFNSTTNGYVIFNNINATRSSYSGIATQNIPDIISAGVSLNLTFLCRNGIGQTNFGSGTTDNSSGNLIIGGYSDNLGTLNGAVRMLNLSMFNSAISDGLRKRTEHSSAFSFKIACS